MSDGRNLSTSGSLTALVVVDDSLVRLDLADALDGAGFAVLEAADGDAALAFLRHQPDIHLVFIDIDLRGLKNGLALAAAVAQGWPAIKILVASNEAVSHGLPEESLMGKPYGRNDVTKAVRAILAR
jgi:CheY-like chemotaxis protein